MLYLARIESEQGKITFTQIYEQYRYTMLHTAMLVLKDQYLAEDAVHNAFLKIIEHLDKFYGLPGSKTRSLIVIITKNKAIDILRKERGIKTIPLESCDYSLAADDAGPLEAVITRQGYSRLTDRIAALDDLHKIVLQLKYVHGYTNDEMAALLDITPKTVNMRLYRAKKQLKEQLEQGGKDIDQPGD